MLTLRHLLAIVVVATFSHPLAAGGQEPAPETNSWVAMTPKMSAAVVAAVQAEANKAYPVKFVGLYDARGEQRRLQIRTGRTMLAFRLSQAAVDGGRYTPKPADQLDVLIVSCGASDFGNTFDCAKVTLKNAAGVLIQPLIHDTEPGVYTNRMGAKWTVKEVSAAYPVDGLRQGFSIDYTASSGVEFTKEVSAEEADNDLLLRLGQENPR